MEGFILGSTKCKRCGKQMRPKKSFYRVTFGIYGNKNPESSVEGLYDLCPNCYKDISELFDNWMNMIVKDEEE